jgi:hypothetical protein
MVFYSYTSDPPRLRTVAMLGYVMQIYYRISSYVIHIKTFLLNHSTYLKKPDQNPLGRFKDLSIHRDRQREAPLFYTYIHTTHALSLKG